MLNPIEEGADRALKPARDLVNWFDETFEARGENDELRRPSSQDLRERVAEAEARRRRTSSSASCSSSTPGGGDRRATSRSTGA